jgi:hypothetical protein
LSHSASYQHKAEQRIYVSSHYLLPPFLELEELELLEEDLLDLEDELREYDVPELELLLNGEVELFDPLDELPEYVEDRPELELYRAGFLEEVDCDEFE